MDRLDYLNRDSFYTGVLEGKIGAQRIIKMLDVHDGRLVVEEKGVYSIEKFIVARRLMYWQVYLHKTVLAAEQLLVNILRRARELTLSGVQLFASPAWSAMQNWTITMYSVPLKFGAIIPTLFSVHFAKGWLTGDCTKLNCKRTPLHKPI
jgi:HD superfamily phosphohydrolase